MEERETELERELAADSHDNDDLVSALSSQQSSQLNENLVQRSEIRNIRRNMLLAVCTVVVHEIVCVFFFVQIGPVIAMSAKK